MDEQTRMGLGKIAYETFAAQRIASVAAASAGAKMYMPPWDGAPSFGGVGGAPGLPDGEKEIWAKVAEAVCRFVPFVITDEVLDAAAAASSAFPADGFHDARVLRAAAEAAGFRVVER